MVIITHNFSYSVDDFNYEFNEEVNLYSNFPSAIITVTTH